MDNTNNTNPATVENPVDDNANTGGNGGQEKTFTQEEVNRIVQDRLARERAKVALQPADDEREKALEARERRLACHEYLVEKGYDKQMLDILDTTDLERFKGNADKLSAMFAADKPAPEPTGKKASIGGKINSTPTGEGLKLKAVFAPPEYVIK